jgi:hypothetical protein
VTGSWVSKLATSPIFMFLTGTGQMYDSFPSATSYKDTERYFRDTDPPPTRGKSKAFSYAVQSAQKINHLAHSKSRARTQYPTSRAPLTQRADTLTSPGRRFLPFLGLNQRQGGYSIIFYTV